MRFDDIFRAQQNAQQNVPQGGGRQIPMSGQYYMGHQIPGDIMGGGGEAMQAFQDWARYAPPPDPMALTGQPQQQQQQPLQHGMPTRAYALGEMLGGRGDDMRARIAQMRQQIMG